MSIYKNFISPFLDRRDSEIWHHRARDAFKLADIIPGGKIILEKFFGYKDRLLNLEVDGIKFENPVIVAAGWDKVGNAIGGLHAIGFAGVEVGSVLEFPQEGNPKPREFIIGDGVAINRMGFNSPGMEVVLENLKRYKERGIPIGISVGKNKTVPDKNAPRAHAIVVDKLYSYGDYFVINVSSPNTPGLRALQDKKPLTKIVKAVQKIINKHGKKVKPLFVKIAPDLTFDAIDDVIDVVKSTGINGIIAVNTLLNPKIKSKYQVNDKRLPEWETVNGKRKRRTWADEMGGLSGDDKDYRKNAVEIIRHIYKTTRKKNIKLTIIGVGGVKDSSTALEMIRSGANLVQVLTAIRGQGPSVAGSINKGIARYMRANGFNRIEEMVGIDVK